MPARIGEERGKGQPLTEEERVERHEAIYGEESPVPARGSGLSILSQTDIDQIAEAVADRIRESNELLLHVIEHEATGGGRVIDPEKAKSTPCKCFTHDSETYAWSPGVLGLISSKKNPEQYAEFCALGCIPAGEGAKKRFEQIKQAIDEAHEEWHKKGGGLPEWWESVGESLEKHRVDL